MYKYLVCLFFLSILILPLSVNAEYKGSAQYSYTKNNISVFLKKADENLRLYEASDEKSLKEKYLKEALRYYYICTKSDFKNVDAHIGLGKVYDEMGVDKYAKMEFNSAYNINNKNPKLNYRYGDFYYKRNQLSMAQHYFSRAYQLGYAKNYDLNVKMSKAYVKLAEPQKAQEHMKIANEIMMAQKQQKTKVAVNSAIRQSSGVAVRPNMPIPSPTAKLPQPTKQALNKPVDFKEQKLTNNVTKNSVDQNFKTIKFEEAVKKANQFKMIDDANKLKPMYYLFIK